MERLESTVFLGICLLVPAIMLAILVRGFVTWLRDRVAIGRTRREAGWQDVDVEEVEASLRDTGIALGRGSKLTQRVERDGVRVARYESRSRGVYVAFGDREARCLMILPHHGDLPRGVCQPRVGGRLEGRARAAANARGAPSSELPGWEWAIVSAPAGWLPSEASPNVRALLRPGEALHIGATHAVLSLPDGSMRSLLEEASERAASVEKALYAGSSEAHEPAADRT